MAAKKRKVIKSKAKTFPRGKFVKVEKIRIGRGGKIDIVYRKGK